MDADSGLVHTVETTSANVHDSNMVVELLQGTEEDVYGDSGYLGAEKKDDTVLVNNEGKPIRYQINKRPSQLKKASGDRAAQGNRTCEIIGAFQSGTCVLRDKENLSFLQDTIPRTGKTASALLHAVCTCEFIPCSQSNEGCVTRLISRANSALELRSFSKFWSPKMTRLVLAQL